MDKKYRLKVNEENVDLFSSQTEDLDVFRISETKSHVIINDKSYTAEVVRADFVNREYTVKINGNTYSIEIDTPLDQLISEMGLSLGNASVSDEIFAPMPGIILEVQVAPGDVVSEGDYVCVLEAMKMENALTAPRDGVVKSVFISKGDTVDKGKLLIEFEEDDQ